MGESTKTPVVDNRPFESTKTPVVDNRPLCLAFQSGRTLNF